MVRKKDPRGSHRGFIERALALPPMPMAVVHPCDRESLLGAVEAARMGLIVPLLIGVESRIRAVAEQQLGQLRGASEAILKEAATLRQQIDAIPKN